MKKREKVVVKFAGMEYGKIILRENAKPLRYKDTVSDSDMWVHMAADVKRLSGVVAIRLRSCLPTGKKVAPVPDSAAATMLAAAILIELKVSFLLDDHMPEDIESVMCSADEFVTFASLLWKNYAGEITVPEIITSTRWELKTALMETVTRQDRPAAP